MEVYGMERRLYSVGHLKALLRQYDDVAQRKNETVGFYLQRFKDAALAHSSPPLNSYWWRNLEKRLLPNLYAHSTTMVSVALE